MNIDAHPSPLFHGVVDGPAGRHDVLFGGLWLVTKSVELVDATYLACPGFYAFVGVTGFAVVEKVEANEGEVAAVEADGGGLARGGGGGTESAECDDGVGYP